jgi:FixJ family two-component response regulator
MSPTTVFIVDDDAAVRDGLSVLCESAGLNVECHNSAESFLACWQPGRRGCLVLDVRMGRVSGPELHEELNRRGSLLPVIYLTGHGDIPLSVKSIKAGATNFLTKPVSGERMLENILGALLDGERLAGKADEKQTAIARLAGLTERERQVMKLAVAGMHNKEIARQLGISHRTVELYRMRVMDKSAAGSLLELAEIVRLAGD